MSNPATTIIEVSIPIPLDTTFSYLVPHDLLDRAVTGTRVLVPFGSRKLTGYVLGPSTPGAGTLREILDVLDCEPVFTSNELEFYRWVASYYQHPLGEVIKAALPAGINIQSRVVREEVAGDARAYEVMVGGKKVKVEQYYRPTDADSAEVKGKAHSILMFLREHGGSSGSGLRRMFGNCKSQLLRLQETGLLRCEEREVYRDPFRQEVFEHDQPLQLNSWQDAALARLQEVAKKGSFAPFLLHGVTGSGKTEVYLQAIATVLDLGKTALVLVPEIALTPQLVTRFKRRFHCGIAVLHSGLTDGERYDEWRRIRRGEAVIVIGARSAIFAPLQHLGIIVVDEEHEASYKQSEGVKYNARDLALVRGKQEHACVILGSATPLVSTYYAVSTGKLTCLELPCRVRDLPLPTVELIDARGKKGETMLPQLVDAVANNLEQGGQTLLFLNRRGYATYLVCQDCGHVLRCPNCAVTLTYHRHKGRHVCHYCDYAIPAPSICPECQSPEIVLLGRGTERVEDDVADLFPAARVARMDRDTTRGKGGHAKVLKGLEEGTTDILIGTQMIAKGHDFPGVTLVGVISADATLNLPDFRSSERAFQLISQVMGRAGRGDAPGRVYVQSLAPDHYAIRRAVAHDFAGFYSEELEFRRETGYPPFTFLAGFTVTAINGKVAEMAADSAAAELVLIKKEQHLRVEILGPVAAPLGKIRGRVRVQILVKSVRRPDLHRLLKVFRARFKLPAVVRLSIDVDPVDMM